jgi:hypothetical protein
MTITIINVIVIAVLTLVCKDVCVEDINCEYTGPVSEEHWFFKTIAFIRIFIHTAILWILLMLAVAFTNVFVIMFLL